MTPSDNWAVQQYAFPLQVSKNESAVPPEGTPLINGSPKFMESAMYKAFAQSPFSEKTYLPDGSVKLGETAPDFSTKVQLRYADGFVHEKVCDRLSRVLFTYRQDPDGNWTAEEYDYHTSNGKPTPFIALTRVTTSAGMVIESTHPKFGKGTAQVKL